MSDLSTINYLRTVSNYFTKSLIVVNINNFFRNALRN